MKNIVIAAVGLILLAFVWLLWQQVETWQTDYLGGVQCTADALMCPDGSFVGRVGPNCEFAACPKGASMYTCTDGKHILVERSGNMAQVTLSDGRNFLLKSDAPDEETGEVRSQTEDGALTLWERDTHAFAEEHGLTTYAACSMTTEFPTITITSFEECVAAGNPVMESFPRQCRASDGKLYREDISPLPTGE